MTSQTDSQSDSQTPEGHESPTQRRVDQLADARARAQAKGLSPLARSIEKTTAVLYWLYRWEWAAAATVDRIAVDTRGGYAQRLKRAGLVQVTEIPGSPGTRHRPRYAVTLTSGGLARATETITEEWQLRGLVKIGPRAAPGHQIEHDHRLQLYVLDALEQSAIAEFKTPAEMRQVSQANEKQPDLIVWGGMIGARRAVELELTAKSEDRSWTFIRDCASGIRTARWAEVEILCRSPAIESRYRRLLRRLTGREADAFLISRLED